jgi:RNA polymerase sigma-70 factor (ECF subfamily)
MADLLGMRRREFEESIEEIRPALHRYCSRMLGSVVDGEDALQDTLAQAFFRLCTLKDHVPMKPWLFRIAHNRCVDILRSRRREVPHHEAMEPVVNAPDAVESREEVGRALRTVMSTLPPKERTCLILKDVLDHSIGEIAAIVDSTENGVKAALHRARGKLAERRTETAPREVPTLDPLTRRYIDCFNAQDWDGVRALMKADARLEVVPQYLFEGSDAFETIYFHNYGQMEGWKLIPAWVDDRFEIVSWRLRDDHWQPWSVVRLTHDDGQIAVVRDYHHVPYLLNDAEIRTPAAAGIT